MTNLPKDEERCIAVRLHPARFAIKVEDDLALPVGVRGDVVVEWWRVDHQVAGEEGQEAEVEEKGGVVEESTVVAPLVVEETRHQGVS